ncbi:MAG: anthranilate synthase component 2 [Polaribacter sp.]|jgi:anthranilate synthase component 2
MNQVKNKTNTNNSKAELSDYKIIMIDNFDSFTYNLVNQLETFVSEVKVYRNDTSIEKIEEVCKQEKSKIMLVISPGPGSPNMAGNVLALLNSLKGKYPILGVCLGHQAIIESYSGTVGHAKEVVHGKSHPLEITSCGEFLFNGITPFSAARYHSLSATTIPENFEILAYCDEEVMMVRELKDKVFGLQFHPESILTPNGSELIKRILTNLVN